VTVSSDPILARLRAAELDDLADGWIADGAQWRDESGNTLLHRILDADLDEEGERVRLIGLFADAGVDPDGTNFALKTPLVHAVFEMMSPDVVRALLRAGADVDFPSEKPPILAALTHMHRAGRGGFGRVAKLLELLVDRGATLTSPPVLVELARRGPLELVERAIEGGAPLDRPGWVMTPLGAAVQAGRADVVDRLLLAGADPAALDRHGRNAVLVAPTVALYERLRDVGVSPTQPARYSPNALFELAERMTGAVEPGAGEVELVRRMVDDGVPLTTRRRSGQTVLHALVERLVPPGVTEVVGDVVRALVESGANPNAVDSRGRTPLDVAGEPLIREVLKACGGVSADALDQAPDDADEVPLCSIAEQPVTDRDARLRELLDAGADPDRLDPTGYGALRQYLAYGQSWDLDLVERLSTSTTLEAAPWSPPLAVAARKRFEWARAGRDVDVVDSIIDRLVDLGARLDRRAVLRAFCRAGRSDLVRMSLAAGADLHAVSPDAETPLYEAVAADHPAVVRLLLEAGADPDGGLFVARSAPVHAVGSLAVLELLVEHGASLVRDPYSRGNLAALVSGRHDLDASAVVELLARLEELGLSLRERDRFGRCAFDRLEERDEPEIADFLALREQATPGEPESGR
jgi:ankyrin repeat protein